MTRIDWVVAVAPFVILAAFGWHAWRRQHPATYRCRLGHCTRHFDTRDERALHTRRAHSMS